MTRRSGLSLASVAVAALALAPLAVAPGTADAQVLSPRSFTGAGLSSQDYAVLREATRFLYESGKATIGQTASWSNPATGNGGTATLVSELQLQGMPCRNLRYDLSLTRPARTRTFSVNWCHTPENTWRIVD